MPRTKKKVKSIVKTKVISARVTEVVHELLHRQAEDAGMTLSEFTAQMLMKGRVNTSYTVAQNCTPNQINKNNLRLNQLSRTKEAYGRYRNVYLEDYSELKTEIAELDSLIDDLSIYMQSTGRKYADHAATLRSWSARKKRQQKPGAGIPDYTYNKEESL